MSSEDLEKRPISVGAWGGQEGISWNDGVHSTVRQIVIAHGACIDSIQIEYDEKGSSVWSAKHGGNGGLKTDKVKLVYPSEFLTSIHGYYGCLKERGPLLVRSITFESNRKTYGPYGAEQGTHFSFPTTVGKIVGFHGKSGWYLDAIGVYLKPLQSEKSSKALVHMQSHTTNGTENVGYSVIQGSAGDNYDIVVALRHKSDNGNSPSNKLSIQPSRDFSSAGNTDKTVSIEKVPSDVKGVATYGPWGGTGGNIFDDGIFTGIRQIHLSRNVGIVWIKIQYDREGQAIWSSKHGGTGGFKTERIIFDFPSEILTHITGTYGSLMYMGPNVIKSLTFHTNKGKRGPFGEEQGPSFSHKIDEGKIAGFHGREGLFLDAIGVHVMECKVKPAKHSISDTIMNNKSHVAEIDNPPWSSKLLLAKQGPAEEVSCGVIKEPVSCGPGPWGGDGGRQWDDGVFSGIRQIFVTRSADAICSIQIEYDRNGQSVWSVKHGGNGGTATHRLKLEYPHEVLTCVSGYYGLAIKDERHVVVIKSLTFTTSRGKYGPFGEEVGTFFTSTTTEGKVVGFHGKSSMYLDAIGVHMQHWLGNNRIPRSSIFKFF